jgi:hypothetical protein
VADVKSKPRPGSTPMPDADPLMGSISSEDPARPALIFPE